MVAAPALARITDDQRAIRNAAQMLARERVAPCAAAVPALSAALRARAG